MGADQLDVPAIKGIGGSLLYFVDRYGPKGSVYDAEFAWTGERAPRPEGDGLYYLDHLTHNVARGRMDVWAGFYEWLFNFREIRCFDIKGEYTGLFSRAMTSPDGKIRIPINESADENSQIEEYLHAYKGEGIQTSPAAAATSTPPSRACASTASPSCPRRPPPTTSGWTSACPGTARTWSGSSATAS